MHAAALAEIAHGAAQLGLDDGVDDDRRPALGAVHGQRQILDRLHPRMADLLELLVRELGLERHHQPRRCLAGRVRDDVQLDRAAGHALTPGSRAPCE